MIIEGQAMIVTVNEQLLFREPSGSYRLALFICPDALRAKQPQCDEDSNVPSNFQPRNRDGPGAFVFVPGGWNVYVETKPPPHHFVETRPTEDLTAIVDPREWKVEELPVISTRVQNDVLALVLYAFHDFAMLCDLFYRQSLQQSAHLSTIPQGTTRQFPDDERVRQHLLFV